MKELQMKCTKAEQDAVNATTAMEKAERSKQAAEEEVGRQAQTQKAAIDKLELELQAERNRLTAICKGAEMERTKAIESAELSKRTAEAELVRKKAAATKLELQLQEERRESEEERNRLVVEHERFVSFMCEFKVRTALAVSLGPPTTFAVSNFKRAYDEAGDVPITHATQVFGFLVTFVHTYCQVHGLNSAPERVAAASFVEKLQRAIADHHGTRALAAVVGEVGATAELLWTSAETFMGMREHEKEFCALLNAAIRSDVARLMPCTAALVRAINALCVAGRKGEARAEFPPNGRTFRGTAFSNEHRQFFVPGTK
jgi:hypothetical protein